MASNSDDENDTTPTMTWDFYYQCYRVNGVLDPQPRNVAGPMPPPPYQPTQHRTPIMTWDRDFECARADGILYPQPINGVRPRAPHPSPPAQHEQPQSSSSIQKRKRRELAASRIVETNEFSLKLFRCEEESSYILEMTEVGEGYKTYYILVPYEKFGKKKIEPREIPLKQRVLLPVIEEINPIIEKKYNLSLKDRLEGRWTIEVRERTGNAKTEKFYFHERVNKTMRSFNDVGTFVLYGLIY